MFDQLAAKVVGFQIIVRAERMHDQSDLFSGRGGGDIETVCFEKFLSRNAKVRRALPYPPGK